MRIAEDIRPVSYFKAHAAEVLEQLNETRRHMIITQSGEPRAVLLDTKSYEKMRDALHFLKLVAQSEGDIKKGHLINQKVVFSKLEEKLASGTK